MYCGKCGKELKPGDRFCPSCGSPAPKPGPNGPGGGKNRGLIAALLIAALLLGAAGGAFWYWNSRRTPGSADPGALPACRIYSRRPRSSGSSPARRD